MLLRLLAFVACLVAALPCRAFQAPPAIVGEVYDGAPNDLCASANFVWLAEGRNVFQLDAVTGARMGTDASSPYPSTVQAIEFDLATSTRVVATKRSLHVHRPNQASLVWQPAANDPFPEFQDVKTWPGAQAAFAVAGRRIAVFSWASGSLVRVSQVETPIADVNLFRRLHVQSVDGKMMAYLIAALASPTLPRKSSMVIVDLDSTHGYAQPFFHTNDWRAFLAYNDDYASSRAVEAVPNLYGTNDVAFIADNTGELTILNVTNPSNPSLIGVLSPDMGCGATGAVYNLARDPTRNRLFVAGGNMLYTYQLPSLAPLGCAPIDFVDAGKRDMALVRKRNGTRILWTATPHAVDYVLNAIDVAAPQPTLLRQDWWIASCDGAVAVPEWDSIYLPTFGGLVRYDVSNETQPVPVHGSYRGAGGLTESIELVRPNPADPDHALLLTATGAGGVQVWPIARTQPDPGAPVLHRERPPSWTPGVPVYENDAEPYVRNGHAYALCDLSNLATHELALQAYDLATGACVHVVTNTSFLHPNTMDVCVAGDFALLACNGGVWSVRLDTLPSALVTASTKLVDLNGDGHGESVSGIATNASATVLFVATDSIAGVASYALDPATGAMTGPLSVLTGPQYPGCVGRIRFFNGTRRLYVPCRNARLLEVGASMPTALQLLSTWVGDGVDGELQDAHVYDFGQGPRVLAVKNTEGFAILDPDDGL
ncbi:MAG: hypothetical protein IPJ77_05205 [Planctomycetes bacterium]|nr:hypothetical protein [Planctomycetota bacterium]